MIRSRAPSAQTCSLLAALLAHRGRWLHGYDLSVQTGLRSGTLYPILMRLDDRGLLESKWEPSPLVGSPPRRLYRLTAEGAAYARQHTRTTGASGRLATAGRGA